MYTVLNVVLGYEITVTFICNESQVQEVLDFIGVCDGSAVDIIEQVEANFDCRAVSPTTYDPFNWHSVGEAKPEDVINLSKLVYDQQMVHWELTVEGYAELNQSDKDLARGIISEAIKVFNTFEGSFSITKDEEDNYLRTCSHCGKGMHEGYCINSGEEYYCSDECLHEHYTEEEYLEMYDDGNGDSYWTEWEILDVVKQLNKKEREGK